MAALNLAALAQSLGIDVAGVEGKALGFLLSQAAAWARLPTRLRRVEAARGIIEAAALQQNNLGVLAQTRAVQAALAEARTLYDQSAGNVADVVQVVQGLQPGQLPPVSLAGQVAHVAAVVTAVTKAVTAVEQRIGAVAPQVLTPAQVQQLQAGGLAFPSFMGLQLATVLKYLVFAIPLYYVFKGSGRGTRKWE